MKQWIGNHSAVVLFVITLIVLSIIFERQQSNIENIRKQANVNSMLVKRVDDLVKDSTRSGCVSRVQFRVDIANILAAIGEDFIRDPGTLARLEARINRDLRTIPPDCVNIVPG